MKTYTLKCWVCGEWFSSASANGHYCAGCRGDVRKAKQHERHVRTYVPAPPYEYTCTACGAHIRVHGRSRGRKVCDRCCEQMGAAGRRTLDNRRDLPEEILDD